jgi:hypothetical protein
MSILALSVLHASAYPTFASLAVPLRVFVLVVLLVRQVALLGKVLEVLEA